MAKAHSISPVPVKCQRPAQFFAGEDAMQNPSGLPPGFDPPLDWFQFAMLCITVIEAVVLSLPLEWQREILQILFGHVGMVEGAFLSSTPHCRASET
jgi:hypothetical protein